MKLQNTFVQGKMNKDVDERLLPKGHYAHAENIRVSNTEGSDLGAIENVLGNTKITNLGLLAGDKCIGAYEDGSRNNIYWFVASATRDLLLRYNTASQTVETLLESAGTGGVLNFNTSYLITGVNLVVNSDDGNDLLFWTDNLNPPRVINVSRFVGSLPDSFTEDDISVIKMPPIEAPELNFTFDPNSSLLTLKDQFLSFATRYKYVDGEISALSSFTYYGFSPKPLDIDVSTGENRGMINNFNALELVFKTGSKNVTDVELVFKRSHSNTVYRVETFNKEDEGWSDNEDRSYTFINNKGSVALPEDELFRSYDNVPYLAKAQEVIGSRLLYGNYVEGFDIKDSSGADIDINFSVERDSTEIFEVEVPFTTTLDDLAIDVSDVPLTNGTSLSFRIALDGRSPENSAGSFDGSLDFILNRDYTDAADLFESTEFVSFIEDTYTTYFNTNREVTPPADSVSSVEQGFTLNLVGNTLTITAPSIAYTKDDTPADGDISDGAFTIVNYYFDFNATGTFVLTGIENALTSVKTNRSYELGLIYMDDYGRRSTVLTSNTNTVDIKQEFSELQNKLKVSVVSEAPVGATKYKFAIKQDRGSHENIFGTVFFEQDEFVWVKLEGSNKDKVRDGDTLIVKSDSSGLLSQAVEVTVLEVTAKSENFIEDNRFDPLTGEIFTSGTSGEEIIEPAGSYMKIKPVGFNIGYNGTTFYQEKYVRDSDSSRPSVEVDAVREGGLNFPINEGASVQINITSNTERRSESLSYEKTITSSQDYASFRDFYLAEEGLLDIDIPDSVRVFSVDDVSPDAIRFTSPLSGDGSRRTTRLTVDLFIRNSNNIVIMETKPELTVADIFYETSETFDIINGEHQGNQSNQTLGSTDAVSKLDFFNTFVMGNGVESLAYLDGFNKNSLAIDLRPSGKSLEKFKRIRRYSGLTYSEPYNEETNVNGLNEFNLSKANFKDDLNKKEGSIQKLFSKDTDVLVFQEDKVSKVLFGKDIIFNADGTSNVSSVENVLGQHVPYSGEFGISSNPESFSIYGNTIYFTDQKRGAVLKLGGEGIFEISNTGMRSYFRSIFRDFGTDPKIGCYDPYHDQYVLYSGNDSLDTVTFDDKIQGWTSFMTFKPDFMVGMNNNFYSFYRGDLYSHNTNTLRNNFYGAFYSSKVSIMVNDMPSEIKELKAVSLEGNYPCAISLQAYVSDVEDAISSSISAKEFVKKEGLWYAHARRSENNNHFNSRSSYGIGVVTSVVSNVVTIQGGNSALAVGDILVSGLDLSDIGVIESYTISGGFTAITLVSLTGVAGAGLFVAGKKSARIEGANLRGYTIRMDLTMDESSRVELFAVNSVVIKSFT
jgi:hypothetical protein